MPRRISQPKKRITTSIAATPQTRSWPIGIVLALVTIVVYSRALTCDFVWYDDHEYITGNQRVLEGLTIGNVWWAFSTFAVANWHPLTWISHMIDVEIWNTRPLGHHLTNILFHAANAMLLFVLLRRMTGAIWRSALVAALFALHPLHVESVAWVSERKDVLSTFFGLLAMLGYLRYVKAPSARRYGLVAVAFACSLLSKPMLVTLPFVLLLLDYWPLRRLMEGKAMAWRVVLEKVPLLVLSAASSVMTVLAQRAGGSIYSLDALPFEQRIANAAVSYVQYLEKMFWPTKLAVLYPRTGQGSSFIVLVSAALLVAISAVSWRLRKSHPHLIIGWLWYLGTLVPVIGLVQVGMQSVADRYTYVPLIGIFLMIAWSFPRATQATGGVRPALIAVPAAGLIVLTMMTWLQIGYWRSSETLFRRTLAVTHNNFVAHFNLGHVLRAQRRNEEAALHFQACLQIEELYAPAHDNLADALAGMGQYEQAIVHYRRAVELNVDIKDLARTYSNLGSALASLGRLEEAIVAYEQSIRRDAGKAQVHFNLGEALLHLRRYEEAAASYGNALKLNDRMPAAHIGLGQAKAVLGHIEESLAHFDQALLIEPGNQEALMYKQRVIEGARRLREQ